MINISKWLKDGIILGYRKAEISFTKVTEMVAGYLSRGLMSEADANDIVQICQTPYESYINPVSENIEEE